jgi:ABC-2 type transport system ATP-binding protein
VKVADGTPKELGEGIDSNVIEVVASDPNKARLCLANQEIITSITQLGIRLRVLIPKTVTGALELVQQSLAQLDTQARVEEVTPGLEDVFVAVTDSRRQALGSS